MAPQRTGSSSDKKRTRPKNERAPLTDAEKVARSRKNAKAYVEKELAKQAGVPYIPQKTDATGDGTAPPTKTTQSERQARQPSEEGELFADGSDPKTDDVTEQPQALETGRKQSRDGDPGKSTVAPAATERKTTGKPSIPSDEAVAAGKRIVESTKTKAEAQPSSEQPGTGLDKPKSSKKAKPRPKKIEIETPGQTSAIIVASNNKPPPPDTPVPTARGAANARIYKNRLCRLYGMMEANRFQDTTTENDARNKGGVFEHAIKNLDEAEYQCGCIFRVFQKAQHECAEKRAKRNASKVKTASGEIVLRKPGKYAPREPAEENVGEESADTGVATQGDIAGANNTEVNNVDQSIEQQGPVEAVESQQEADRQVTQELQASQHATNALQDLHAGVTPPAVAPESPILYNEVAGSTVQEVDIPEAITPGAISPSPPLSKAERSPKRPISQSYAQDELLVGERSPKQAKYEVETQQPGTVEDNTVPSGADEATAGAIVTPELAGILQSLAQHAATSGQSALNQHDVEDQADDNNGIGNPEGADVEEESDADGHNSLFEESNNAEDDTAGKADENDATATNDPAASLPVNPTAVESPSPDVLLAAIE